MPVLSLLYKLQLKQNPSEQQWLLLSDPRKGAASLSSPRSRQRAAVKAVISAHNRSANSDCREQKQMVLGLFQCQKHRLLLARPAEATGSRWCFTGAC